MKHLHKISCFLMLLVSIGGYAQNADLEAAYNCVQRGSIDSAKTFIDRAMKDNTSLKNSEAWYIKGFIYKELYKKYESRNTKSPYRDTAINDLFVSCHLDTTQQNKDNIYPTIKYLAATYYNDAAANMDTMHYYGAIRAYNRYKVVMKKIAPATNFNTSDAAFYNQTGEIYTGFFFNASSFDVKKKYLDSARKAYDAVLAINPDNFNANYGLGRLYYNQAVNIMNNTKFDDPIQEVERAQDTCVHLAKLSLPYMEKAHKLEPLKMEPIKGLEGNYYLLHDTQKFQEFEDMEKKLREQSGQN